MEIIILQLENVKKQLSDIFATISIEDQIGIDEACGYIDEAIEALKIIKS